MFGEKEGWRSILPMKTKGRGRRTLFEFGMTRVREDQNPFSYLVGGRSGKEEKILVAQ